MPKAPTTPQNLSVSGRNLSRSCQNEMDKVPTSLSRHGGGAPCCRPTESVEGGVLAWSPVAKAASISKTKALAGPQNAMSRVSIMDLSSQSSIIPMLTFTLLASLGPSCNQLLLDNHSAILSTASQSTDESSSRLTTWDRRWAHLQAHTCTLHTPTDASC